MWWAWLVLMVMAIASGVLLSNVLAFLIERLPPRHSWLVFVVLTGSLVGLVALGHRASIIMGLPR